MTPAALAEWLSKSVGPIGDVHEAESILFAALYEEKIDFAAIDDGCLRLGEANGLLPTLVPTPDSMLTAEVQQAIDDFDTASNTCNDFFVVRRDPGETDEAFLESLYHDLVRGLYRAEQHLANADGIVAELAAKS